MVNSEVESMIFALRKVQCIEMKYFLELARAYLVSQKLIGLGEDYCWVGRSDKRE